MIDEFSRQHVTFGIDRSINAKGVIELLDLAVLEHGAPRVLRMDNGPEFISKALKEWVEEQNVAQAFIPPGQPWHNGFVESLHNRMRDELLEDNSFEGVDDARKLLAWWSKRYNEQHPHSALGYLSPNAFAEKQKNKNTTAAA